MSCGSKRAWRSHRRGQHAAADARTSERASACADTRTRTRRSTHARAHTNTRCVGGGRCGRGRDRCAALCRAGEGRSVSAACMCAVSLRVAVRTPSLPRHRRHLPMRALRGERTGFVHGRNAWPHRPECMERSPRGCWFRWRFAAHRHAGAFATDIYRHIPIVVTSAPVARCVAARSALRGDEPHGWLVATAEAAISRPSLPAQRDQSDRHASRPARHRAGASWRTRRTTRTSRC
jgi:hypothetical protein